MAAVESSLKPFWTGPSTPSVLRFGLMSSAIQRSSFDLTARNTISNSMLAEERSHRWSARIGPGSPPSGIWMRRPPDFIASTCAGHWSMTVTSRPAFVRSALTLLPIAPAPSTAIFLLMFYTPVVGCRSAAAEGAMDSNYSGGARSSLGLDAGNPDHLCPFLYVLLQECPESFRRASDRHGPLGAVGCPDRGTLQG